MRLQTMDGGHPVHLYTVAKEAGHASVTQIEETYGHLLDVRQRFEHVEYRPLHAADAGLKRA